ncbi:MAG: Fe-Mn family superoxide dismutase [Lentimonas sp.]|jgi:Fe-Mn family superoxide dismutase
MKISKRKLIKTTILGSFIGFAGLFLSQKNRNIFTSNSNQIKKKIMTFQLPNLPYAKNALEPHMSENTLNFHYGKHHQAYVTNLNKLIEGSDLAEESLEKVIKISAADASKAGVFNNAAQVWNHTFYWNSMKPNGGGKPNGELLAKIEADFGSFENFVTEFKTAGATQFGSGWAWLVLENGKLKVTKTANALTPLTTDATPLLTMDVWEHAYYLDFQNARPTYMATFLDKLVNWDFVAQNLKNA